MPTRSPSWHPGPEGSFTQSTLRKARKAATARSGTTPVNLLTVSIGYASLAAWVLVTGCGGGTSGPAADAGGDATASADAGGIDGGDASADAAASDALASTDATDVAAADAGPDGATTAVPIVAPDDTWTWVDFPASKCASGTPTGLAVNPHAGATALLVYFEGGGSCYDATTCWGPSPGAENLAGYDATVFASAKQRNYPVLDRSTPGSPFGTMNMVYVPYCTGDLHFGTTEQSFMVNGTATPTYFWGARDLDLFLLRLAVTFPNPSRITSFGTSAGGFASFLDFDRIATTFGVRVDILDDSGPPLATMGKTDNSGLLSIWGGAVPAACSGCTSFLDIMEYDRQAQPASRLGFLSLTEDTTISADFGYTLSEYGPALEDLFSNNFGSDANVATFFVDGDPGHVVESQVALAPDYLPWMTEFVGGGSAWANVEIDAADAAATDASSDAESDATSNDAALDGSDAPIF
jgi:hypothetical protein